MAESNFRLHIGTTISFFKDFYLKRPNTGPNVPTDVEIAKKVHIVGLNDENIKQLIYLFCTDKATNRPINTLTF